MSVKKEQHLNNVLEAVNSLIGQVVTIQDFIHKSVMIEATRYAFIYKDATIIEKVLNSITSVKGSFRVESLAYWFKDIAGLPCEYSEQKGWHSCHFAKDEYKSNNAVPFSYDKVHLDFCKQSHLRFWKIAPVTIKELKAPELEKVTSSAEIQLARGLAIGALTEEEVAKHISDMLTRVKEALNSKSVKKWVGEYHSQHKPSADPVETEIAELMSDLTE